MPEQTEIPQPVQWAVNVCAEESQRTAKIDSDIAEMDRRIAATEVLLTQLRTDKDRAADARIVAARNAEIAREMAEVVCSTHGWAMPEIPAEAPLLETTAFPVQQTPGTATCRHCKREIRYQGSEWVHTHDLGFSTCYPDAIVSPEAAPMQNGPERNGTVQNEPVVPPATPAQPWSQEDAWKPLMGQRITVSYADGSTVTGVLEDTSYRRYRLTDVPGYPADEVYVGSLASVTDVVPAQPSPPPADQPPPASATLPDSDPVQRVDLSATQQGGAK
jgi:hypothetical protein